MKYDKDITKIKKGKQQITFPLVTWNLRTKQKLEKTKNVENAKTITQQPQLHSKFQNFSKPVCKKTTCICCSKHLNPKYRALFHHWPI